MAGTQDEMLADLRDLVEVESPSDDPAAIARSADVVAALGTRLLGQPPVRHGDNLLWRFGRPRVLLLGHHDTVWPVGTLARRPFAVDDDRVTGPGCFDMKAGLVMAFHAVAAMGDPDGMAVLVTCDEEVGAPTSRELIVATARDCLATLVCEPAIGPAVKIARKGMRNLRLHVTGRAAHAGLAPHEGVNAGVELARHLVSIATWDLPGDTTLVPTVLQAGTTMNTVPASASALLDLRAWEAEDLDEVTNRVRALESTLAGATTQVEVTHGRGPLESTMAAGLYGLARDAAEELGLGDLPAARVGGVSDGNFTAAAGVPTLDGLGATGDGAHAQGEWCSRASLVPRTRLLAALAGRVIGNGQAPRATGTAP